MGSNLPFLVKWCGNASALHMVVKTNPQEIVWYLQLPVLSVPITTDVVGSIPARGEDYNIM